MNIFFIFLFYWFLSHKISQRNPSFLANYPAANCNEWSLPSLLYLPFAAAWLIPLTEPLNPVFSTWILCRFWNWLYNPTKVSSGIVPFAAHSPPGWHDDDDSYSQMTEIEHTHGISTTTHWGALTVQNYVSVDTNYGPDFVHMLVGSPK